MNTIEIPPDLIAALKSRKCAALVGAGVSQGSGLPGWGKLLTDLITDAERERIMSNPAEVAELKNAVKDSTKFLAVAQHLSDKFGETDLRARLAKVINTPGAKPSPLHKIIIENCFRFIITTNYDRLLEDAYAEHYRKTPVVYTHKSVDDFANALWEENYFILKAHGDINERTTIILTEKDYRKLIYTSPGYRHLLASVFTNYLLLFVGASLSDPEINLMLSSLHSAFHGSGKKHYALIEESGIEEFMVERWRKDYNINILRYRKSDDSHPEVLDFIQRMHAAVK